MGQPAKLWKWFRTHVRGIQFFGFGVEFEPTDSPPGVLAPTPGEARQRGVQGIRRGAKSQGQIVRQDPAPIAERRNGDGRPSQPALGEAPPSVDQLWHAEDKRLWCEALNRYEAFNNSTVQNLVKELEPLSLERIRSVDEQGWFRFLYDKYFPWKFTNALFLANARKSLNRYVETGTLSQLHEIKQHLLVFPKEDIAAGLAIADSIRGLGPAGASGLLALMYPEHFGTIDQFAVKALRGVRGLPQADQLSRMNPNSLTPADGVVLINIMREKAAENNRRFRTSAWGPRKIDQILWTYGR